MGKGKAKRYEGEICVRIMRRYYQSSGATFNKRVRQCQITQGDGNIIRGILVR